MQADTPAPRLYDADDSARAALVPLARLLLHLADDPKPPKGDEGEGTTDGDAGTNAA